MRTMRILVFLWLCLWGRDLMAQEKEWGKLIGLLQKEAGYFEGKNGFIQLGKSNYNTFLLERISVTDTLIVLATSLQDRFGNEGSEQYVEETIALDQPETEIVSAQLVYDHPHYFSDFPKSLFLLMEFKGGVPMVHRTVSVHKNLNTGQTDRSQMEGTTTQILFPIRNGRIKSLFWAIDQYQLKTLKPKLESDRTH